MNGLAIAQCLRGYASAKSRNRDETRFANALELHLQGNQHGALEILGMLARDYQTEEIGDEYLEISQLQIACLLTNGSIREAEEQARQFHAFAQAATDDRWIGLALASISLVAAHLGHSKYSIDLGTRAKQNLASHGSPVDIARACSALGYALALSGEYNAARRELETSANLAQAAGAPTIHAAACRRLAFCQVKQASFLEAAAAYQEALQIYQDIGATRRIAQINFNLANMYCLLGDIEQAEKFAEASAPSGENGVQGIGITRRRLLRAWLQILKNEPDQAIEILNDILPQFSELNSQRDEALCHEFLGDAHRGTGDFEKAAQHYELGLELGRMVSVSSDVVLECLRKSAELMLDQGELADSLMRLRQALKLAQRTGDRFELACLLRLRGKLKHTRGQRAVASNFLEDAWHKFRGMGAIVEANRTAEAMSSLLHLDGKAEEARVWSQLAGSKANPKTDERKAPPRGRKLSGELRTTAIQAREEGIISSDPRILNSFQLAVRAAGSHLPSLIMGETGSGKELFASTIHAYSQGRGSFIPVNCAALPPDILDAELFGHSRGAFTGAFRDRAGLIEAAAGGTLFLDEIGEMGLAVQGRLLRAIELGEIRRLGESRPRKIATRFVAATHRNLEEMVRKGTFRADLFFRLKGIIIHVPPLRERAWDIDMLVDHFLSTAGRIYRRSINLTPEARERLRTHPWPGNVRELKSVIERLVSMNENAAVIDVHDLGIGEIRYSISLEEHLEEEEKRRLIAILDSVQWNKSAAARILKLKRTTLLGKLKRLGITTPPRS